MVAPQLAYILPSLNDYLSKDWLETREKALMADLAYESAAGGRRNRAYFIEKLMKKEKQGKVLISRFLLYPILWRGITSVGLALLTHLRHHT